MLRGVDPQQIALVRTSFAAATVRPGALTRAFYERLFAAAPELRSLFTSDPEVQARKLAAELEAIVERLDCVGDLVARTRELGSRHAGYGARPAHYEVVGEALLGALEAVLGRAFTAEVAGAWRYAYNLVAEAMLQGAATTVSSGRIGVDAGLP